MRKKIFYTCSFLIIALVVITCRPSYEKGQFGHDLIFLKRYTRPVILESENKKAQLVICPEYQGRVMTSTADGMRGMSYGWINHGLIKSGKILEQFNPFGGEDRFWMGPEGGQHGLFFENGNPFDWDHWQPPAPFDKDTFKLVYQDQQKAVFEHDFELKNYSKTKFTVKLERTIRLLNEPTIKNKLGISIDKELKRVAFQSSNKVQNMGKKTWKKNSGLLSTWILGVFMPSPSNTVFIPTPDVQKYPLDSIVNTGYYWDVPKEQLAREGNMVFFKADGDFQCKIGIPPHFATGITGSYDPVNQLLTLVEYSFQAPGAPYVNSLLKLQEKPYQGDVMNFYNDGVPIGGTGQYGPFYEIETSSPALSLKPGESHVHVHTTYHFQGSREGLSKIVKKLFGIDLETISNAFINNK